MTCPDCGGGLVAEGLLLECPMGHIMTVEDIEVRIRPVEIIDAHKTDPHRR